MTLPTGKPTRVRTDEPASPEPRPVQSGFTLIELILVMTMLAVVLSVAAPSLSRFFRGRTLDSEATRFLALTRYGQSRAVSEGLPMVLWIDPKEGAYGLQADSSYTDEDSKAVEFELSPDVQVEVDDSILLQRQASVWTGSGGLAASLPKIRFHPDGFISENNPGWIVFRQGDDGEIWIGPSRNHLHYEIQTNHMQGLRR